MPRLHRVSVAVLAAAVLALVPLGAGALAASSSGADGDLVFVAGSDILISSSGTSTTALSTGAIDPAWSPNGTKLAVSDGGSIKTCTASDCSHTLSSALATGTEPAWSPDGTKLAYANGGQVWTMSATGGTPTQLTSSGGADPSWSPTSIGKIVFANGGGLYTIDASTPGAGTALPVSGTSGSLSQPAWSPDGSEIAFQALDSSGHLQIWVVPYNGGSGGTATQVTPTTDTFDHTAPSWSPSGSSIVFAEPAGIYTATGSGSLWGTPTQRHSGSSDATPDWQTIAPIDVTLPTITGGGSPQSGQLLTAANGVWQGADSDGFTYQWQSCDSSGANCSDISGATSQTYAVLTGDIGHTLRVVVTASNAAGSSSPATSAATGVVAAAGSVTPPSNVSYPSIRLLGSASELSVGSTVLASIGSWTGTFPITYSYQWKRCEPGDPLDGACYDIPGATSALFRITPDVYGMRLRVAVTATNSAASASQNSPASDVVTADAPDLRITPPIVGNNTVGQVLSVTTGVWSGSQPITFSYQWKRCDPQGTIASCVDIAGATSRTYVLTSDDVGDAIRAFITGTNVAGSQTDFTNHTYPVQDKAHYGPSSSIAPEITGTVQLSHELTASMGSFSGDSPISTTLVWQRCDATGEACHDIAKATKTTYTPTATDVGSTLRIAVTAKNAYGTVTVQSSPAGPVLGVPPRRPGRHIVGTAGNDYIVGTANDDTIDGLGGNDTINGNGGYDTINGGPGNDIIMVPGPGSSVVDAGPGSDTIYAANGFKDTIDCGPGRDRAIVDPMDVVHNCEVVVRSNGSSGSSSSSSSGSFGASGSGSSG